MPSARVFPASKRSPAKYCRVSAPSYIGPPQNDGPGYSLLGAERDRLLFLLDESEACKSGFDTQLLDGFDAFLRSDFFDYAQAAVLLIEGEDREKASLGFSPVARLQRIAGPSLRGEREGYLAKLSTNCLPVSQNQLFVDSYRRLDKTLGIGQRREARVTSRFVEGHRIEVSAAFIFKPDRRRGFILPGKLILFTLKQ